MQITEWQIGSDSKLISFQSAAPQFTVVPLGGSSVCLSLVSHDLTDKFDVYSVQ